MVQWSSICLPMQKTQETQVQSPGGEDPLEKEMATHSSVLAWKIPWTEKPGRLQSMGSQSRTQLSDFAFTFHFHGSFRQGDKNAAFLSSAFKTVIWDYNGFLWLL